MSEIGRAGTELSARGESSHLIRGTATYTAGSILQRAATFLLLPLFTRILTPAEFGQVGVLTTVAAAVSVIVSFGLETAIFRGTRQAAQDGRAAAAFLNTVGGFALLAPLLLAAIFSMLFATPVATALDVPPDALRLASLGAALTASATLVPLAVLRAQERLRDYIQLTALQVVLAPLLIVLFVAVLDWGVTGWMLAFALSSLVLLGRGLAILGHRWSMDVSMAPLRVALAFGLPLVPHALSHWGLSVSDRAILGAYVPAPDVGVYYVAYLLCLPISLLAIATSQATQPLFSEAASSASAHHGTGRAATVQAVLVVFTAIAVSLVGPSLIDLFLPSGYAMATTVIPLLALGTALFGLYLMPMNAITITVGRTQRVWIITVVAAATNIGLNLVFVPSNGILAAAVNTTIGYGVLLIGVFLYMRRVCDPPMPYDVRRIGMGVLVIGVPAAVAALMTAPDSWLGFVIRVLVLMLSAVALLVGPFRREATVVLRAIRPSRAGRVA